MGRKKKYMATGFASDGLSSSQKNRIIIYLIIGGALLAIGVFVFFVLPKMGVLNNPYEKEDTGFKMGENSSVTATPSPLPPTPKNEQEKRQYEADSERFTYAVEVTGFSETALTEEAYSYNNGTKLKGYAKVTYCHEHEEIGTIASMELYSNGKDNFLNHLNREFDSLCIDPGKEPPHDGKIRNGKTQWDGNKPVNWYKLTDYGYTATLSKTETETGTHYDWAVVINFNYGASSKYAQRMKFHIAYDETKSEEE